MSIRIGIGLGLIPTAARPAATTAPVNVVKPFFDGPLTQGQSAAVNPGAWTGLPSPNFAYAIKRGATTVSTDPAYVWTSADVAAGASAMTVAVTATNDIGPTTETSDPVTIAAPLALSGSPPAATVGALYSFTPTRTGGHAPFSYLLDGTLPTGLAFDSETGEIAGTPVASGSASITINVVDGDGLPAALGPVDLVVNTAGTNFVTAAGVLGDFAATIPVTKGVTSVSMPSNGWVIRLATSLGAITAVDPSKLSILTADAGYSAVDVPATQGRTITGTGRLYKPNGGAGAFTDADQGEGVVEIALDQQIYRPGGVTANGSQVVQIALAAGFITTASGPSPAVIVSGVNVTRGDSADYPLSIPATVNWIGQRMDASNTLDVEYAVIHEHARNGRQVAGVKAWARIGGVDGPAGASSEMVDSVWTAGGVAPSGLHQPVFRVPVSGGSLADGEGGIRCTVYPWIGPAMNSFDPGIGDTWPSMNLLADHPFVKDTAGKYAPVYVWVNYDGTGITGSDLSGVSTSDTDPGAALSYTTFRQAALAGQAWNNANRGHNTYAGVVIMLRDVAGSAAGANFGAYCITEAVRSGMNRGPIPMEIRAASGVTSELCRMRGVTTAGVEPAVTTKEIPAFVILRNIYEDGAGTSDGNANIVYTSGISAPTSTPSASAVVYWPKIDCKSVPNSAAATGGVRYSITSIYRGETLLNSGSGSFTAFSGSILRIGERREGSGYINPGVVLACQELGIGIGKQSATNPGIPSIKFQLYYNSQFHCEVTSTQAANFLEGSTRAQQSLGLGMVGCVWRRYGSMSGPFFRIGGDGQREEFRNVVIQHVSTDGGAAGASGARINMFYNDQGFLQARKEGSIRFSALATVANKDGWFGASEKPNTSGQSSSHNSANAYWRAQMVYVGSDATSGAIYQALRDVPAGVAITDASYWESFGAVGNVAYGNQPRRNGADRFRYGVGSLGNVTGGSVQGVPSDTTPGYGSWLSTVAWPGSGTKWGQADPGEFYVRSTGGGTGSLADLGDYRPNPAGPLVGMVPAGMAVDPFDAFGTPRPNDGTGAAGALEAA